MLSSFDLTAREVTADVPLSVFVSLVFFVFISGITPGPANLTTLAAALNYGKQRALTQWRGILAGFAFDSLVAAALVWTVGTAMEGVVPYLSWIGAAYILYLAWHIWRSDESTESEAGKTCSFRTGFLLQTTNVKVIVTCLTAQVSYVLPYAETFWPVLAVALFLPCVGPSCNLVWLFAGVKLRALFARRRKLINGLMALSLIFCAASIVLSAR